MSVANKNVFALLDDEGTVDAGELAAKLPVTTKEANTSAKEDSKQGRDDRAVGGDKARRPIASRELDTPAFDAEGAPGGARGRPSRGPAGGHSRPGRGRAANGDIPRKREYDRHDASGRGHEVEKRHGGGRGNWGAEGEEASDLEAKLTIADPPAEGAAIGAADPAAGDALPVEVEEEEKQLSLEEYEVLLAEKRAGLNTQRESAFKADEAQFQGMKTFEKVEDDAGLSLNKNVKTIGTNKAGRDKERKERDVVVDVGFRISSEGESRGGRGGRGEGRTGRGGARNGGRGSEGRGSRGGSRGAPRPSFVGPRGGTTAIKIDDTSAFPSLG